MSIGLFFIIEMEFCDEIFLFAYIRMIYKVWYQKSIAKFKEFSNFFKSCQR